MEVQSGFASYMHKAFIFEVAGVQAIYQLVDLDENHLMTFRHVSSGKHITLSAADFARLPIQRRITKFGETSDHAFALPARALKTPSRVDKAETRYCYVFWVQILNNPSKCEGPLQLFLEENYQDASLHGLTWRPWPSTIRRELRKGKVDGRS